MKKSALWAWCLVAWLAGAGYVVFSHPGLGVSAVMVGLPLVLALVVGIVGQE